MPLDKGHGKGNGGKDQSLESSNGHNDDTCQEEVEPSMKHSQGILCIL